MEIWVTVEIRTVDGTYGRRDRRNQPKSRTSVNDSESLIWTFFCQYLSSAVKWGLYEHIRTTPRPTRCKLGDITASRAFFRVIFVPRDPLWQLRSKCSRAVFCHNTLGWDGFLTSDDSENPCEWANTVRRKTNLRTSESDKNWPLWTEKCPWSGEVISYLVILDFKIFFSGE